MNSREVTELKRLLYNHCREYIDGLLNVATTGIAEAQEAARQEGKSSAGDKFETHRAMMHLQLEGFIRRLEVAKVLDRELQSISYTLTVDKIKSGALVETDRGWYFVAVSAPPLKLGSIRYVCLSSDAPIYRALANKGAGDLVEWRAPNGEEGWIDVIEVY